MTRLSSKETKELLEKSAMLEKGKQMKLRMSFQIILLEVIERVDDGYNALIGNKTMANEYSETLLEKVKIRFK